MSEILPQSLQGGLPPVSFLKLPFQLWQFVWNNFRINFSLQRALGELKTEVICASNGKMYKNRCGLICNLATQVECKKDDR